MFRKILYTLGVLMLLALFYVGVIVAGGEQAISRDAPLSLPPAGSATGGDLGELAAFMGCALPRDAAGGIGAVQDAAMGSLQARLLTWQAQDGLVISAVCPAEAASLIRRQGLSITSDRWSLSGVTLLLATGDAGACAYYDTPDAAYAFYLPGADADALLGRLAGGVTFPSPNQE